jgi:tetratricopeptide (TPR) repeat protein
MDSIEEEEGRILNDAEIARVINDRDDIFLAYKNRRLSIIVALFLLVDILTCLWLSTAPPARVAPELYARTITVRTAKLLNVPAALPQNPSEESVNWSRDRRTIVDLRSYAAISGVVPDHPGALKPAERRNAASVAGLRVAPITPPQSVAPPVPEVSSAPVAADVGIPGGVRDSGNAGGGVPPPSSDPGAEDSGLIFSANADKRQGNYAPAFAAYGRVLKNNPRDTLALAGVGDLFLYSGLLDSALAFYKSALAVNPRMVSAHKGLGTTRYYLTTFAANPLYAKRLNIADPARYIQSQYDSAMAEYSTALSIDSSYVSALTDRGVLRDFRKDYDGAIGDYTRAIRINPSFADAYSKRAMTYRTLGNYKLALADYTTAIRLGTGSYAYDPNLFFANVYFGRGVVYRKMGEFGKAVADFDTTLALSPRHSLAVLNKAIALSDAKKYDSAIASFTLAIAWFAPGEYDGARFRAYLNRGDAFTALGRYDQAIEDYKNALALPALAAKACWRIAECYALKRDRDTALAWLGKSIGAGFNDFKAWEKDPTLSFIRRDKEFRGMINATR